MIRINEMDMFGRLYYAQPPPAGAVHVISPVHGLFSQDYPISVLTTELCVVEMEVLRYENYHNDRNAARCSRKLR